MVKLNNYLTYRSFVDQRDLALEHFLNNSQLEITDHTNKAFNDVLAFVYHSYTATQIHGSGFLSKDKLHHIDRRITDIFSTLAKDIFFISLHLRNKTALLTYASEVQAINQTVGIKHSKISTLQQIVKRRDDKSTEVLANKIVYTLNQLRRKIIGNLEFSLLQNEDPHTAMGRIFKAFPKAKQIGKRRALTKVVKTKEAATDTDPQWNGFAFSIDGKGGVGIMVDPTLWGIIQDEYNTTYVPSTRNPEDVYDLNDPTTGGKIVEDIPKEDRVYGWEIERDTTNDFVDQVRQGQISAANDNGIDDFVVITIIDNKTCDGCCGDFGCIDFANLLVSEITEMTNGDYAAPPYHFNCRCTVAPATKDLSVDEADSEKDFTAWLSGNPSQNDDES